MTLPSGILYPSSSGMRPTQQIIIDSNKMDESGAASSEDSIRSYVDWINISLQTNEEVEVIGVDPALPKTVSVVVLLTSDEAVGVLDDVYTPRPLCQLKTIETITVVSPFDKTFRSGMRVRISRIAPESTESKPRDVIVSKTISSSQTWVAKSV
ncbi:hypothetical protein BC829DRAFT_378963 [Chytridium lagenaria]|nr:hypothetical protein BC829DRAFT_378963 [Chytridium lagenaria]